jgi:hypothetical protein
MGRANDSVGTSVTHLGRTELVSGGDLAATTKAQFRRKRSVALYCLLVAGSLFMPAGARVLRSVKEAPRGRETRIGHDLCRDLYSVNREL